MIRRLSVLPLVLVLLAGLPAGGGAQAEQPAVVWALGDGADGSTVARRMAGRVVRDEPDALLYLGDVYPHGTAEDFELNYTTTYGPLAPVTWPTMGNHDFANRAVGYYPYWRRYDRARPWYRTEIAGWQLIALNSEVAHRPGSRQLRWLAGILRRRDTNCRIAFWHRPRFSVGSAHGDAPDTGPLWSALRGHARLVLNGHDHVMTRFRPRDGLTEYVAGAGGAEGNGVTPGPRVAFARSDLTGGLRMTLFPGRASLQFRSVDGEVLDRSRATCEPAPS